LRGASPISLFGEDFFEAEFDKALCVTENVRKMRNEVCLKICVSLIVS
jgi:hypothetical protein